VSFRHASLEPGRNTAVQRTVRAKTISTLLNTATILVDIDGAAKQISLADLVTALGIATSLSGQATAAQGTLAEDALPRSGGEMTGNITMSQADAYLVDGRDVSVDGTKMDTIETSATADQTDAEIETAYNNQVAAVAQTQAEAGTSTTVLRWTPQRVAQAIAALETAALSDAQIKTAYENNANTNEYDDAEQTKLAGIESSATADQTGAEIKTAYEAEANAYTDTKNTKLAGIETSATADQSDAEVETAYNNQVGIVSQAAAEAGTSTTAERWSPLRVAQAIAALESP
jgi:hypothetical protein